jgi:Holliday junction DNA helicase RuvB
MILNGPPGLGKTALVHVLASVMGGPPARVLMGPRVTDLRLSEVFGYLPREGYEKKTGRLLDRRAAQRAIIAFDECEAVPRKLWESLHTVMQPDGGDIPTMEAKLPGVSKPVKIWVPECTIILLTNYIGRLRKVAEAAVNRCSIQYTFQPYSVDDLMFILQQHAQRLGTTVDLRAIRLIAERSMGTPRTAIALLKRVRARMVSTNKSSIDAGMVESVLGLLDIDRMGLTAPMREYLQTLADSDSGKMGVDSLAARLNMDKESLTVDVEPFLIRQGFVTISGGGRQITEQGMEHLGRGNPILSSRID